STGASTPNFIPSVYQIYSQQIAADGTPLISGGTPVSQLAPADQLFSQLLTDGAGGAFVVWEDYRVDPVAAISDIYAQHLDSILLPLASDIVVSTAADNQFNPQMVSDG